MTGAKIVARRTGSKKNALVRSLVIPIILVWSGACAADILNPGFEMIDVNKQRVTGRALPLSWTNSDHSSFNSYCTNWWSTAGQLSAAMYSRIGKYVVPGNSQGFYQIADLTGMGSIKFDVNLEARPEGSFGHFEAVLLVGGVVRWSRNAGGVYRDQVVDIANLAGWQRIEFRLRALEAGTFGTAYWTEWDNFRLIEKPKIIPAVISLDPAILNPASNGNWLTCYIELTEKQDVRTIDGASVTLNGVPAYMGKQDWATPQANDENVADFDNDGTLERMVRFDRAAVAATIQPPQGTVTVQGRLTDATAGGLVTMVLKSGTPFEGATTLGVLTRGGVK